MFQIGDYMRLVQFVSVAIILAARMLVTSQTGFTVHNEPGKVMSEKHIMLNESFDKTGMTMSHCLQQCLENCRCLSFQICDRTKCELSTSSKDRHPTDMQSKRGCIYFDFEMEPQMADSQQCDKSCSTVINCCLISNPCLNGGTCIPSNQTRYICACPDGFYGVRCHMRIRSCRGYKGRIHGPGIHIKPIYSENNELYSVSCYVNENDTSIWTLVQSYRYKERGGIPSLLKEQVHNENRPGSLDKYRLPKSKMLSIQNDTNKWALVCPIDPTFPESSTEYIFGEKDEMDVFLELQSCYKVLNISVAGASCDNCTVYFKQDASGITLHFPYGSASCQFNPVNQGGFLLYGNYFGSYKVKMGSHACAISDSSYTQLWFGGD